MTTAIACLAIGFATAYFLPQKTKVAVFGKRIYFENCTYAVRGVESSGFVCRPVFKARYDIGFNLPNEAEEEFEYYDADLFTDGTVANINIREKMGGYTHYYTELSATDVELTIYYYQLCNYRECMSFSSTEKNAVFRAVSKFSMPFIRP